MSELHVLLHAAAVAAADTPTSATTALSALPWLRTAIATDRAAESFSAWGASTAVDENTGAPTIPRALFDALHEHAGVSATWPVGNAGLLHCYGYLLSLAPTPYGFKRDRWLDGALAAACGLPQRAFDPWAAGPTLLARATAAATAILAAPALVAASSTVDGRETRVGFAAAHGPTALAFAVAPTAGEHPLLVTLFPVADPATLLADADGPTRLRWNAV